MPKATLSFELPEEQHDFDCAINGQQFKSALIDMYDHLRNLEKNGETTTVAALRQFLSESIDLNLILE